MFSLNEPVCIIKVKEKGTATEPLNDIYGHEVLKRELHSRGSYLKMVRSKNITRKQFQIISLGTNIPPDKLFKTFIEVADDFTKSTKGCLGLCEPRK